MIRCRVLGPVEVIVDGGPPLPELLWRKHLALLIYLARSPRRARTREHLVGLLWPEKDDAAARHSLNEALRILRRAAGETAIDTAAGQVRLDPEAVSLDTDELERAIAAREWPEATAIVAGEFMEGFAVAGCAAFEDWLASERAHWRDRGVAALVAAAADRQRLGRAGEALSFARRAAALDPHSDPAARSVMEALALLGEVSAARGHFDEFRGDLARDLGTAPAQETLALAQRLGTRQGPRALSTPSGEPRATGRRPPLIGREPALRALLDHWERTRGGTAGAVLLEGDPGTGKSRLLEELATRARLAGCGVSLVRCVEADSGEPGSGVLGLAGGGLLDSPGLAAASPDALGVFARVLPAWADRFPGAKPGTETPLAAFRVLLEAVLAEGPLLLVVDDAQWADRESLLALQAALRDRTAAPLFLCLAAEPEPRRPELDELRRRLGSDVPGEAVGLGPFAATELRELVAWAFPGYEPVALERLSRRIASDSAGLPLLAVELLAAVAGGLELKESGVWPAPLRTLSHTLPGDLPDTVVAAFRIGFRRVSSAAQQLLGALAALGGHAAPEVLSRATGLVHEPLDAALDELEWRRWIARDGRGYAFVARIARDVINRDMLTPGQRARLVAKAGFDPA